LGPFYRSRWLPLFSLLLAASPAFALPGDLDAVEQHCGQPRAESQEISQVTNQPERTLFYPNDVVLHFEAVLGGWTFTSGWHGNLPLSREDLQKRLPCFRNAMAQLSAQETASQPAIDPTIAAELSAHNEVAGSAPYGIPHFWLILLLCVLFFIGLLLPDPRSRAHGGRQGDAIAQLHVVTAQPQRKPRLLGVLFRLPRRHIEPDLYL
jgi:hypothetical protein